MGAIFQGDELLIILVILLLILGPTKLPALAKGLGQAVREFRKASSGYYDEDKRSSKGQERGTPAPKGLAPGSPQTPEERKVKASSNV
ncbi:MAG: twin-arginine translocase TatA/TatE family subunit [Desulfurococcales archaeon]|nr:twin-arginine translocase TatA/TatE family subunit [Desulfurococcales archaeon]